MVFPPPQVLGPQEGIGTAETAAWWLTVVAAKACVEWKEMAAAEAPTAKSPKAKARTMSFMVAVAPELEESENLVDFSRQSEYSRYD